jgi:arginyl-tRNA synthetase
MRLQNTDLLTEGLNDALSTAGLPAVGAMFWEVPRDERHGDYATNVAMTLARAARQTPRKVAEAIVSHFPKIAAVGASRSPGRLCQRVFEPGLRRARSATPEPGRDIWRC